MYSDLETYFDHLLLNNVEIYLNEKLIKKGQVKIINVKNNLIKFTLIDKNTLKNLEFLYPFSINKEENCITLSYQSNDLFYNKVINLKDVIRLANKESKRSSYYNNIIKIKKVNE